MLYKTTPAVALELLSKIKIDLYQKYQTQKNRDQKDIFTLSDNFLFDQDSQHNFDSLKDLFLFGFQQNFGFDYLDLFDQKGGFRDFGEIFEGWQASEKVEDIALGKQNLQIGDQNKIQETRESGQKEVQNGVSPPNSDKNSLENQSGGLDRSASGDAVDTKNIPDKISNIITNIEKSDTGFQQRLTGNIRKFIKSFIASIDDQVLLENSSEIKIFLENTALTSSDLAFVKGQKMAKRALEIAASGGHNIMFIGQPGSGKTLIARSYTSILPKMLEEEILQTTQIYSVAGLLDKQGVVGQRPFRAPHHSCSHIALVGGGSKIKPGEVSLAHRGVLFLDEFPEFERESIEALRQPLEDGFVQISRASGTVVYPAKFYLIAAANPTPSGFDIDDPDALNKPQNRISIARYQAKFSGPIMDRIDIHVEVNRPTKDELNSRELEENSASVAARVQKARDIQTARFLQYNAGTKRPIMSNSEMTLPMIQKFCELDAQTQTLLDNAVDKFKLSARSYMRILKLSRTIADLDGSDSIKISHLAESLQYRSKLG